MEDQTFQDGILDDGMTPSPEGLRGDKSPDWPEPERDHGHVGKTDEQEGEEMGEVVVVVVVVKEEVRYGGWRWESWTCSTAPCRQRAA